MKHFERKITFGLPLESSETLKNSQLFKNPNLPTLENVGFGSIYKRLDGQDSDTCLDPNVGISLPLESQHVALLPTTAWPRYGHVTVEAPQAATVPPGHGHRSAALNASLCAFNAFCHLACKSTGLRDVRPLQLAHTEIFKLRRLLVGVLGKDLGTQVLRF